MIDDEMTDWMPAPYTKATVSKTWIFTFGYGQTDPRTGQSLADCYVVIDVTEDAAGRPDLAAARRRMLDRFGNKGGGAGNWAFDYPDEEAAGVERYGLTRIDFDTGGAHAPATDTEDDKWMHDNWREAVWGLPRRDTDTPPYAASDEPQCGDQYHRHTGSCFIADTAASRCPICGVEGCRNDPEREPDVAADTDTGQHTWRSTGGVGTATIVSRIGGPAFAVLRHGKPDIGLAEMVAAALNAAPWLTPPASVPDADSDTCQTCVNGLVPATGRGSDGYEPCPDCGPDAGTDTEETP